MTCWFVEALRELIFCDCCSKETTLSDFMTKYLDDGGNDEDDDIDDSDSNDDGDVDDSDDDDGDDNGDDNYIDDDKNNDDDADDCDRQPTQKP